MAITRFRDDYFFLSNMYPLREGIYTPDGVIVHTSEQLYLAARLKDTLARIAIESAESGFAAKRHFKEIEKNTPVIKNWDKRIAIMRDCIRVKFAMDPELVRLLVATGDEELIEYNNWHDTKWGVFPVPQEGVKSEGENLLGQLLMEARDDFANSDYSVDINELITRIFSHQIDEASSTM